MDTGIRIYRFGWSVAAFGWLTEWVRVRVQGTPENSLLKLVAIEQAKDVHLAVDISCRHDRQNRARPQAKLALSFQTIRTRPNRRAFMSFCDLLQIATSPNNEHAAHQLS